ncbi:MAG: nodulation protein NfeD [Pirellulaceae bacterium]
MAGRLASQPPSEAGQAFVLTVDDAIGPAMRDHIVRGIEQAEQEDAELVVLRMNTPGGLDASMRDIIRKILNARVPVATWVAPSGSRAASAGTYILYASHIAAMAPSTSLGAATPVRIGGGGGGGDDSQEEPASPVERVRDALKRGNEESSDPDSGKRGNEESSAPDSGNEQAKESPTEETTAEDDASSEKASSQPTNASSRKAINDAVAYIRGLAERHGRNAEWAERAVTEAATLTASEAVDQNVVDLLAANLPELLTTIDGREVQMESGSRTLHTANVAVREIETDWRTELLAIITNPTLAYILLMVGIYGLILEGYNPGSLVPGVIGGVCLLLALYAFQILPVNYAGLALMALGLALIAVELFVPSFGILGIGGVVAVVFGSVILFDADVPGFGINTGLIAGMGLASALVFAMIVYMAARAFRKPRLGGRDSLIGHQAEAIDTFEDGQGRVHLQGEDWSARADVPIERGQIVRITGMQSEGFVLDVEPVDS